MLTGKQYLNSRANEDANERESYGRPQAHGSKLSPLSDWSITAEIRAAIQRAVAQAEARPGAPPWALTITRLDNGFAVVGTKGAKQTAFVLEEKGHAGHQDAMTRILLEVCRWFGDPSYGADADRIEIHWNGIP